MEDYVYVLTETYFTEESTDIYTKVFKTYANALEAFAKAKKEALEFAEDNFMGSVEETEEEDFYSVYRKNHKEEDFVDIEIKRKEVE